LKLVVLNIRDPSLWLEHELQNELFNVSLGSLKNQTGSGMSHSVVKEQAYLSGRKTVVQSRILTADLELSSVYFRTLCGNSSRVRRSVRADFDWSMLALGSKRESRELE
jgi:hypothetical protein